MKRFVVFIVSSMLAFSVFAATPVSKKKVETARANIEEIKPAVALKNLKTDNDIILLDVRSDREYEGGHVSGALWSPRGLLDFKALKWFPDKNKTYYIYCKSGSRGAISTYDLKQLGYKVYNIEGGFKALKKAGAKIVTGRAKDFAKSE